MSRIAIVGGHGNVARQLLQMLPAAGHQGVALVRRESYREDLEGLGAEVRVLDLEKDTADDVAAAFAGCHAVVFAAGGGADGDVERKRTVDLGGSLKSIQGAQTAGIDRFVQVSAMGVDKEPDTDRGEVWAAYVEAKRDADSALRDSGLAWTIVRPGRLTDDSATGRVRVGVDLDSGEVTRADVAAVLLACLDDDTTIGRQFDLVAGDVAVTDAVHNRDLPGVS